jgi:hypothetical protein
MCSEISLDGVWVDKFLVWRFGVEPDASAEQMESLAAQHLVFRIERLS